MIQLDAEFQSLMPPLTDEERFQLHENIKAHGCRDPLSTWNGILIDGYNRFQIAKELNVPCEFKPVSLPDRVAAQEWIIRNQLGRRNLTSFTRAELVLRLKPLYRDAANLNRKGYAPRNGQTYADVGKTQIRTDVELAKAAKVGPTTIHRVETILKGGNDEIKDKCRTSELSIKDGYDAVKQKETLRAWTSVKKAEIDILREIAKAAYDYIHTANAENLNRLRLAVDDWRR